MCVIVQVNADSFSVRELVDSDRDLVKGKMEIACTVLSINCCDPLVILNLSRYSSVNFLNTEQVFQHFTYFP